MRRLSGPLVRARGQTAALIVATHGALACRAHASPAECRTLLDRYVELLVREQDPKTPESELERQKQATRDKAASDPSFAHCPEEVTRSELGCAMRAPNVDDFEKCLE